LAVPARLSLGALAEAPVWGRRKWYESDLAQRRTQNIDTANIESELEACKSALRLQTVIEEINKFIDHMRRTTDALLGSN
jgi:hypothetical protein